MMKSVRDAGTVLSPHGPDSLESAEVGKPGGAGTDEPGGPMAGRQAGEESQSEGLLGRIVVESGGNVGSLF